MATITRMQPRIRSNRLGGAPTGRMGGDLSGAAAGQAGQNFYEAAAQSYKMGDLVYWDSSGNVAIATVDGSGILNVPVLGIATKDATGVTGSPARVAILTENDLVEINLWHSTPASAAAALTQLGKQYGIEKQASIWSVDLETNSEPASSNTPLLKVQVVKILDDIGDLYARVLVKFLGFTLCTDGSGIVRNLQG